MKKLFISLLFLLSASFMFADTLHVFVPYCTRTGEVYYKEAVFKNVKFHRRLTDSPGTFWTSDQSKVLHIRSADGKLYNFSRQTPWYSEPDGE